MGKIIYNFMLISNFFTGVKKFRRIILEKGAEKKIRKFA
jgi:hypothetical protein